MVWLLTGLGRQACGGRWEYGGRVRAGGNHHVLFSNGFMLALLTLSLGFDHRTRGSWEHKAVNAPALEDLPRPAASIKVAESGQREPVFR